MLVIAFAVNSLYSMGSCQNQASIKTIDETGGKDSRIGFSSSLILFAANIISFPDLPAECGFNRISIGSNIPAAPSTITINRY